MTGVGVHRLAVATAWLTFAAVAGGALSASLPGAARAHLALSVISGFALAAVSIRLRATGPGLAVIGMLALASLLGLPAFREQGGGWAQAGHALVSHGIFACAVVFAVVSAPGFAMHSETRLEDRGVPSLRTLSWITSAALIVQIALGAAYRHKALGVIPHVVWAFAAAVLVMLLSTFVLATERVPVRMRFWAITALSLTGAQILLGVGAYFLRVAESGHGPWMAAAHVATGGMVLAACAALWAHIRVSTAAIPQPAQVAESGRTS